MRFFLIGLALAAASAQDFSKISVDKVVGDLQFTEGPVWSRAGFLLFSDVPSNRILKLGPGDNLPVLYREGPGYVNGNTMDARGRLYSCESRGRRVVRVDKKGKMELLAEHWEGKCFNAFECAICMLSAWDG